ncbi:hypothetical protein [Bacillus cereus]|uniref:hypothetical protein n=1 Tax=Bacillus cereus TaxID=1396 RepID=UPI003B784D6F
MFNKDKKDNDLLDDSIMYVLKNKDNLSDEFQKLSWEYVRLHDERFAINKKLMIATVIVFFYCFLMPLLSLEFDSVIYWSIYIVFLLLIVTSQFQKRIVNKKIKKVSLAMDEIIKE